MFCSSLSACLLPIKHPDELCSCDPASISISAGRPVSLICINGTVTSPITHIMSNFIDVSRIVHRLMIGLEIYPGRYDLFLPVMTCKTCLSSWRPEVEDLPRSGYWPGTIGFQTIFHLDLFLSFEELKISAPGLSREAFVKMLKQRSQQFGRVGLHWVPLGFTQVS